MTEWHGYIGISNLGLNESQRETLIAALKRLGQRDGGAAHERMQARPIRADRQAAIFEATFESSHLTITATKQRLATIFGVQVASIDHIVNTPNFGSGTSVIVTFSRNGTDYLRVAVFGGIDSTWAQSNAEVRAFLDLDRVGWEDLSPEPEG